MSLDLALVVQNATRHDGQGRAALETAWTAVGRGHSVTVYAHSVDHDLEHHVRVVPISERTGPQTLDDLAMLRAATRAVDAGGHDVACVVGPTAVPACPTLFYAHFSYAGWRSTWTRDTRPGFYQRLHTRVGTRLERRCAAHAVRVVAPSPGVAAEVTEICGTPAEVVPNGIDLGEFGPVDEPERQAARSEFDVTGDAFVIAFVGDYTTPRKGLASLIRGLAASDVADACLLVAGRGDDRELTRLAHHLGVESQVEFAGFRPARQVIAAAHAVAVPSHYEPFSLVALEAAASGVPLLLSARAGAAAVLGDAAFLINDPTDVWEIGAAIRKVATMPAPIRDEAGARCREAVADLTWERSAAKVVDAIQRVASERMEVSHGA